MSAVDRVKWLGVAMLVAGGIVGNWYFQEQSVLIHALALAGLAVVTVLLILQTGKGRELWVMAKEARTEVRRVVWPTRPQAMQTTMIVIALVLVVALILWGLDSLLSWGVQATIG